MKKTGQLGHFAGSDVNKGWPDFMRVNPIIFWEYQHIWDFLIGFNLKYCSLYDRGYTSLGAKNSTIPNPHLKKEDGSYHPANHLLDGSKERDGRSTTALRPLPNPTST